MLWDYFLQIALSGKIIVESKFPKQAKFSKINSIRINAEMLYPFLINTELIAALNLEFGSAIFN